MITVFSNKMRTLVIPQHSSTGVKVSRMFLRKVFLSSLAVLQLISVVFAAENPYYSEDVQSSMNDYSEYDFEVDNLDDSETVEDSMTVDEPLQSHGKNEKKEKAETEFVLNMTIQTYFDNTFEMTDEEFKAFEREHAQDEEKLEQFQEQVIGCIGKGMYGRVSIVRLADSSIVARKQISIKAAMMTSDLIDLKREITAIKNLSVHPSFPEFIGCSMDLFYLYVDTEYISGGTLRSFMEQCFPLSANIIKHLSAQILAAIDYLGSRGLVHCDLNSCNVMLTADGRVKIIDFGFMVPEGSFVEIDEDQSLGVFAPDVLDGPMFPKADVWSWGFLLFMMVVGQLPFADDDWHRHYLRMQFLPTDGPIRELILLCLNRNIQQRPHSTDLKRHPFFIGIDWNNIAVCPLPIQGEGNAQKMHYYLNAPKPFLTEKEIEDFDDEMESLEHDCSEGTLLNAQISLQNWFDKGCPEPRQ